MHTMFSRTGLLAFSLITCILGVLTSCNTKIDASSDIAMLDSAYVKVEETERKFNTIDRFNTINFFNGIKADLDHVQKNFVGEMDYDAAKVFADYRSITKLVKDFERRHNRTKGEIQRTKTQLFNLKQALEQGATVDSEGNEFTAEYIEMQRNQELRIAEELVSEIDEMIERLKLAESRYNEVRPQVESTFEKLGLTFPEAP